MNKKDRETVISHLVNYKTASLGIEANGTWWRNRREYMHILPKRLDEANIIDKGYQSDILELIAEKSRHLGFHHLDSSQALYEMS